MIVKLYTLDGISRRKDRSITVRLTTVTEQTSEDLKILDMMYQQHVLVALKQEDTPFLNEELKDLDGVDLDLEDKKRSPSKRLRNVLYVWQSQQLNKKPSDDEWKDFYKTKMEVLIEHVKGKLE